MQKRGQLTIFIVIAIIIAAIILILFIPKINITLQPSSPQVSIENCMSESLSEAIGKVSSQGGSINPENTILFQDTKIEYLCYTNQYYLTCTMQQPFLKQHIEKEIASYVKPAAVTCINNLKNDLEKRNYNVQVGNVDVFTELVLNNINLNIQAGMTVTGNGESQKYASFSIRKRSNLYQLVVISTSILNWEARYGDSDPLSYMLRYPDLKVEKLKQGDGSKIYILTDRTTNEKFMFATRSQAWPAGYGISEILRG